MNRFLESIGKGEILVADGGMGSMLLAELPGPRACLEELCLSASDVVLGVHLRYIQAGARIIETNSFGATRHKLAAHGLEGEVARINSAAVKLAREARDISGKDVIVAGSIGPSWHPFDPADPESEETIRALFREQAEALDARGVDLFVLETFGSVWELSRALEAVRSVSSLPVIGSVTFPSDQWEDREPGPLPGRIARQLLELGLDAVGSNCSNGPRDMLTVLDGMRKAGAERLFVAPNTGIPRIADGRFHYPDSSPEYFAWFAREAARRGARIIGGCCGTTPAHIKAIAEAVAELEPEEIGAGVVEVAPPPSFPVAGVAEPSSGLAVKLREGKFVVSIQIDPPKGTNAKLLLETVDTFRKSGIVDAVDVNSNPLAHLHMDSLWMSAMCEALGMETIPHITTRDGSLMGIEASLMGAWALGIRNLLVITGDPSQSGDLPGKTDVYQTDSIGLVREIRDLNAGRDCGGNPIGDPPAFLVGVAVNPTEPDLERELERFRRKVESGAKFAMTQVFFDWSYWDRFLELWGGPLPIPVLVAVWPLTSYRLAMRLHNEVPGIIIPKKIQELLEKAGGNARREGFALAKETLAEARRRAAGVYVIAPFKSPATALDLLG
jgi:homocysteine S-methyltransferase